MKENQLRHTQNLALFTGFYHGKYYREGIHKQYKEGTIFKRLGKKKGRKINTSASAKAY